MVDDGVLAAATCKSTEASGTIKSELLCGDGGLHEADDSSED
jgi:hypothetical protein